MRHRSTGSPFSLFSFQDIITGLCGIMIFLVLIMLVDIITQRAAESVPVMAISDAARLEQEVAQIEEKVKRLLAELRARRDATATTEAARRRAESELADAEARVRRAEDEGRKADKAASDAEAAKASAEEKQLSAESELADVEASTGKAEAEVVNADKAASEAAAANASASERVRMLEARATELEKRLEELKKRNRITLIPEEGFRKKPVYLVLSATDTELASPYLDGGRRNPCGAGEAGFQKALSILHKLSVHDYCVVLLVRPDSFDRMERVADQLRGEGFDVGRDPIGQNAELDFGGKEAGK